MREEGGRIKYFVIAFFMCVFVVLYVWQNIEVMKIKMEFRKLSSVEKELIMKRDLFLIDKEIQVRMDRIEAFAAKNGYRALTPDDIEVIEPVKKKGAVKPDEN